MYFITKMCASGNLEKVQYFAKIFGHLLTTGTEAGERKRLLEGAFFPSFFPQGTYRSDPHAQDLCRFPCARDERWLLSSCQAEGTEGERERRKEKCSLRPASQEPLCSPNCCSTFAWVQLHREREWEREREREGERERRTHVVRMQITLLYTKLLCSLSFPSLASFLKTQ